MSIWRGLVTVAANEFRHIRHDPLTLVLTLGMPALQLVLFGFAIQVRVEHVPTAVLNHDRHARSRAFIRTLERSNLLSTKVASSEAELLGMLRSGRVSAGIEIPENFSSSELYRKPSTLRIWLDNGDTITSTQVLGAAEALAATESVTRILPGAVAVEQAPGVRLDARTLTGSDLRASTSLIPGLLGILIHTIPLLLTGLSIVKEKESGTWEQALATPLSGWSLLGGKLAAYSIVGFAEGCALVAIMTTVFQIRIQGSLALLLLSLAFFLVPSVGLGLLITLRARHQVQALQMTYLIFLPSILISGFIFPRANMPTPIYQLSCLLPTTYFIRIVRSIVVRGATFQDLQADYLAVLALSCGTAALLYWAVRSIRD